jgi:HSP20 family protein
MTMLMRTDPFRELEQLTRQLFGQQGTGGGPRVMPMDAYRQGEQFVVQFDLPGVDPSSIDIGVQRNVLTVKAERTPSTGDGAEVQIAERPSGVYSRQLFLGEALDTEHIEASYDAGVLTLRISVAEPAKPRKIEVSAGSGAKHLTA